MAGVAENLNVRITLTLEKKQQRLKWCVGGSDFPSSDYRTTIKRLLRDYQTTFPLRRGNFILTATVDTAKSNIRVHFINFVVESQQANRSLPHVFVAQDTVADLPYQLCNFESFFVFFIVHKGGRSFTSAQT